MRAAIYARYSSDRQHERSIDDQVALCEKQLTSLGASLTEVYADYAISGAHLASRPSASRMLADAAAGGFDIVITEALDRLSRDQEHIAAIYKQLTFAGVRLHTVSEGDVSELHIGLKGTMNALFLRDLAAKIRRGQTGRVKAGKVPGGRAYGYDVVKKLDAKGEPERGERRINEAEARVVRRIFREFAAGMSSRDIAKGLNREGISSPTGGIWNVSTINGNRKRRSGILYNEGYLGYIVYNRVHMVKDPATGKRLSRPNPPEEWIIEEAPHLRIIEPDIWDKVQARKQRYADHGSLRARPPRHIFSGLMRCGCCGGSYQGKGNGYIGCSRRRNTGTCDNDRTMKMTELEDRVLTGIKEKLLAPEIISEAIKTYHEERRQLRKRERGQKDMLEKQLASTQREIDACVRAVLDGLMSEEIKQRLPELERTRDKLKQQLDSLEEESPVVELHPNAATEWQRKISGLAEALKGEGPEMAEARELVRSMVSAIEILPDERSGKLEISLHGSLAGVLNLTREENKGRPLNTLMMVAEEGLEPPTRGL